jgi:hypothetical protein
VKHYYLFYSVHVEYSITFLLLLWTPGYPQTPYNIIISMQFMLHAYFVYVMSLKMIIKKSKHVEVLMYGLSSIYCSIVHFVGSCIVCVICKLSLH